MELIELSKLDIQEEDFKEGLNYWNDQRDRVELLENHFKKEFNAEYAISTTNGTSAIHLALCALELRRGDKIICSVNSHPNIPEMIRHFDAEPIFVDIEEDTFNIDMDVCERVLQSKNTKKLRGMILTHIAGQPCNLEKAYELKNKYDLLLLVDVRNSYGGHYKGKLLGSAYSDIAIFSMFPEKENISANGGMMITNNGDVADRASLLRFHAITKNGYSQLDYIYDVVDLGYRYDISQIDAGFYLSTLKRKNANIARHKEIAQMYNKALANTPHIKIPQNNGDHNYSLYIIKVDKNRDGFAKDLLEKHIQTGLHYIPLHLLNYYKTKYSLRVNSFPNALRCYQQILSLPYYNK